MKTIFALVFCCAIAVVVLGFGENEGSTIDHDQNNCKGPGSRCSNKNECCKPKDMETYTYYCGSRWDSSSGDFVRKCVICNRESSMC
uniref:Toxin ICK-18 n=1 Tax=Trittame loki TaxID=1295018 RepID=TX21I_TRILK|nr:RecName: Full=Toxin ICK-18; Flags: Precursor [Trittame loki]